jgi:hypothetical protein
VFLFFSLVVPVQADTIPGTLDPGFNPETGANNQIAS